MQPTEPIKLSNRPFIPLEGFAYAMKIAELAWIIQNKGIATSFCDISGHVAKVSVSLHAPQWLDFKSQNKQAYYSSDVSLDMDDDYYEEKRNKLAKTLVWILENKCLPGQYLPIKVQPN